MMDSSDLVATWEFPLSDRVHKVEFEHGTTTGKRVIRVDGQEIHRKDFMFKLVGKEHFQVGKTNCVISIEAVSGFSYEYTLEVGNKPLQKFIDNQKKVLCAWVWYHPVSKEPFRICLEKNTLDVWVNGEKVETIEEFGEDGTEYYFAIASYSGVITAQRGKKAGKGKETIVHTLTMGEQFIPPANE